MPRRGKVTVKRREDDYKLRQSFARCRYNNSSAKLSKMNYLTCTVHIVILILGHFLITDGYEQKSRVKRPRASDPQEESDNNVGNDYDERNNALDTKYVPAGFLSPSVLEYLELGKSIPGRPGTDYPVLGMVPYTNFYCDEQQYPGFYADEETRCQTWHYCDIDGRQTTFLCPNGTQFNQLVFACDWWFNVRCELSSKLYIINSRLYGRPKLDPTRPHRTITKQLLEEIFNDEE